MSFFFLPTDVWIPSGSSSQVNPAVSVWLKSSIVAGLACAPAIPLLRSWALYVRSHFENLLPRDSTGTALPFRGASEVLMQHRAPVSTYFRGAMPLLAAIPIGSAFYLTASLSGMMATELYDKAERLGSAATAVGAIVAGELFVQPLRFIYFQQASSIGANPSIRSILHSHGFLGLYRGVVPAMAASALFQLEPHFVRFFGLNQPLEVALPVQAAFTLSAYICYATSFRMAIAPNAPASLLSAGLGRLLLVGSISLLVSRAIISRLQSGFSSKSYLIPI